MKEKDNDIFSDELFKNENAFNGKIVTFLLKCDYKNEKLVLNGLTPAEACFKSRFEKEYEIVKLRDGTIADFLIEAYENDQELFRILITIICDLNQLRGIDKIPKEEREEEELKRKNEWDPQKFLDNIQYLNNFDKRKLAWGIPDFHLTNIKQPNKKYFVEIKMWEKAGSDYITSHQRYFIGKLNEMKQNSFAVVIFRVRKQKYKKKETININWERIEENIKLDRE